MIEIIEQTLNLELNEKELKSADLKVESLWELSIELTNYFKNTYSVPTKREDILRPFIPLRYNVGTEVSHTYLHNSLNADYFNNAPFIIEENIKAFLLYSHEICIQNPLTYLLDYFSEPRAERQLPAIRHILIELARLKPLVNQGVLHLLSDELWSNINQQNFNLQQDELNYIIENTDLDYHLIQMLSEKILESLYEQEKVDNNIDLFFTNSNFSIVYAKLLEIYHKKYVSSAVLNPMKVGMLGQLELINTSQISLNDIIYIRNNDDLFNEWRLLISETLDTINTNTGSFSDFDNEFVDTFKIKYQTIDSRLIKKLSEDSFFKKIGSFNKKAIIGLLTGGILGAATGDFNNGMTSFVGSTSTCLFELISNILKKGNNLGQKRALKNHMLIFK